jgi:hypothetical protein
MMTWSSAEEIQDIVYSNRDSQRDPKFLSVLNNSHVQLTRALLYEGYIRIRYSTTTSGLSWEPMREAYLNLTHAGIPYYRFNYFGLVVFEENMVTKYFLFDELINDPLSGMRLIKGYIEESNETFIIEDIEYFSEEKSPRDFMIWNKKPTILYNVYGEIQYIGIAVYNNSQFNYFEVINVDEDYLELLACNGVLHVVYNNPSEHLQISEIELSYQDTSWSKTNTKTISQRVHFGTVCDAENSDNKEVIVYYRSCGYFNEGFDTIQFSEYIIKLTLILLVLVIPYVYNIIKKRKTNRGGQL